MSALANAVAKLSRPTNVTRRTAAVYDGTSPRPVTAPVETTQSVRLHLQRSTDKPKRLVRLIDGDETDGETRLWVTDAALAAVGWTELKIAPNEDQDGPGGDLVDWQGTRYEVTEFEGWSERFGGDGDPAFLRYLVEERGAAP